MKALKQKWNSSRGASIFLALLLLLLCVMAGASVVMAATSNAGKIRSNKDEQQKYLTLSSALTLMCDELATVEYAGNYSVSYEPCSCGEATAGSIPEHPGGHITYGQKDGTFTVNGSSWALDETSTPNAVLPLHIYLDSIFAERFMVGDKQDDGSYRDEDGETLYIYKPRYDALATDMNFYTLTLEASDASGITSDGFKKQVAVGVRIYEDRIVLNASIADCPMEARATMYSISGKWPKDLTMRTYASSNFPAGGANPLNVTTGNSAQWELGRIEKIPTGEGGSTP